MKEHLDENRQRQLAFFLTGRAERPMMEPINGHRPALFAGYQDLTSLRYDFPLVLNENGPGDRALLSLSALIDDVVATFPAADRDRLAKHGHRIEQKIRLDLPTQGSVDLGIIWKAAAKCLSKDDRSVAASAGALWQAFDVTGRIVDVDAELPRHVISHVWRVVQRQKTRDFIQKAERLLFRLREIIVAEEVGSATGRSPERLRAGMGTAFSTTFDFEAFSKVLGDSRSDARLSDSRRSRIENLIDVISNQRFYPLSNDLKGYDFEFQTCSEALAAYNDRYDEAVSLLRSLAVADLEVAGDYREQVHDLIFNAFGHNGLSSDQVAKLPDYLICTNTSELNATETAEIIEILAAGRPFRILVTTDDVLERSKVGAAHTPLAFRSRHFVDTAIGLSDVFVYQASASDIARSSEFLMRAASYDGPALFSIFSGVNDFTRKFSPYLVAAAAVESRVFPTFAYDPSSGDNLALRLNIGCNASADRDWPVHSFSFEDTDLQAHSVDVTFTLADLMAMDQRFARHFALLPDAHWNEPMLTVADAIDLDVRCISANPPMIQLVDEENRLYRALVDEQTLDAVRRSRTMWRILREQAVRPSSAQNDKLDLAAPAVTAAEHLDEIAEQTQVTLRGAPASDDPFIETPRCTTCNECTGINSLMFAYNGEKQAYIADPDAGTYRQLVEAAESCQVSIIHPGKPRNPKEPGLDELVKRAEPFN